MKLYKSSLITSKMIFVMMAIIIGMIVYQSTMITGQSTYPHNTIVVSGNDYNNEYNGWMFTTGNINDMNVKSYRAVFTFYIPNGAPATFFPSRENLFGQCFSQSANQYINPVIASTTFDARENIIVDIVISSSVNIGPTYCNTQFPANVPYSVSVKHAAIQLTKDSVEWSYLTPKVFTGATNRHSTSVRVTSATKQAQVFISGVEFMSDLELVKMVKFTFVDRVNKTILDTTKTTIGLLHQDGTYKNAKQYAGCEVTTSQGMDIAVNARFYVIECTRSFPRNIAAIVLNLQYESSYTMPTTVNLGTYRSFVTVYDSTTNLALGEPSFVQPVSYPLYPTAEPIKPVNLVESAGNERRFVNHAGHDSPEYTIHYSISSHNPDQVILDGRVFHSMHRYRFATDRCVTATQTFDHTAALQYSHDGRIQLFPGNVRCFIIMNPIFDNDKLPLLTTNDEYYSPWPLFPLARYNNNGDTRIIPSTPYASRLLPSLPSLYTNKKLISVDVVPLAYGTYKRQFDTVISWAVTIRISGGFPAGSKLRIEIYNPNGVPNREGTFLIGRSCKLFDNFTNQQQSTTLTPTSTTPGSVSMNGFNNGSFWEFDMSNKANPYFTFAMSMDALLPSASILAGTTPIEWPTSLPIRLIYSNDDISPSSKFPKSTAIATKMLEWKPFIAYRPDLRFQIPNGIDIPPTAGQGTSLDIYIGDLPYDQPTRAALMTSNYEYSPYHNRPNGLVKIYPGSRFVITISCVQVGCTVSGISGTLTALQQQGWTLPVIDSAVGSLTYTYNGQTPFVFNTKMHLGKMIFRLSTVTNTVRISSRIHMINNNVGNSDFFSWSTDYEHFVLPYAAGSSKCVNNCDKPNTRYCSEDDGSCLCEEGFGGNKCQYNWQASPPNTMSQCTHYNEYCDTSLPGYNKCDENAVGVTSPCMCNPGYTGTKCEKKITTCDNYCVSDNISSCNEAVPAERCVCKPGWTGATCNIKTIISKCTNCSEFNTLSCNENADVSKESPCICMTGWAGDTCERQLTRCDEQCVEGHFASCNTNAVPPASPCICKSEWLGDDCSIASQCSNNRCNNNGFESCNENAVAPVSPCVCKPFWSGDNCSVESKCNNNRCTTPGYKQCNESAPAGQSPCICNDFYYGDQCENVSKCIDNRCDATGYSSCNESATTGQTPCVCKTGYIGDRCETISKCHNYCLTTHTTDCNETAVSPTSPCICETGWIGATCATESKCNNNRCDNTHLKECNENATNGQSPCVCNDGWLGDTCATESKCNNNRCDLDHFKECNENATGNDSPCVCDDGYEGDRCEIKTSLCKNYCTTANLKECNENANIDQDESPCVCNDGWLGATCSTESKCNNNRCNNTNLKECNENAPTGQSPCVCNEGWLGDDCSQESKCNNNRCDLTHFKECDEAATGEQSPCVCDDGYEGDSCEIKTSLCKDYCSTVNLKECNENATTGESPCICNDGWVGDTCATESKCNNNRCDAAHFKECDENVTGNDSPCVCDDGYEGDRCEIKTSLCKNYCTTANLKECNETVIGEQSPCICNDGWKGDKCDVKISKCDNYCAVGKFKSCSEDAADGTSPCVCNDDYIGDKCDEVKPNTGGGGSGTGGQTPKDLNSTSSLSIIVTIVIITFCTIFTLF